MTAVTPTDRPKSVRNSCVIKVFGGVFMLSRCFLDCSVGVGVFVTGLSQISSFFYYNELFELKKKASCFLPNAIHNMYKHSITTIKKLLRTFLALAFSETSVTENTTSHVMH